jgi:hypothetical protein
MNLIKFIESFPDESSCRIKFKEFRDAQGVFGTGLFYFYLTINQINMKTQQ